MAAISLAIVGKNNEPLYLKEFVSGEASQNAKGTAMVDESLLFGLSPPPPQPPQPPYNTSDASSSCKWCCSIKQQFLLHAALDRLEQLAGPPPGYGWRTKEGGTTLTSDDGMFVGMLGPIEDQRIYAYVTTTKIKFILATEDDAVTESQQQNVDREIQILLKKMHELYVEEIMNPFQDLLVDKNSPMSKAFDTKVQQRMAAFNSSDGMI